MELGLLLAVSYAAFSKNRIESKWKKNSPIKTAIYQYINMEKRFSRKIIIILSAISMSVGLFYSTSRGGIISASAGLALITLMFLFKKEYRKKGILIVLLSVGISFVSILNPDYTISRFKAINSDYNTRSRFVQRSMDMFSQYKLTGIGVGNFRHVYPKFQAAYDQYYPPPKDNNPVIQYAHNDWVHFLSEAGITGFAILAAGYLDRVGATYEILDDSTLLPKVAQIIATDNVVGWFQGAMEFGPRSLGARSILGDPRSPKILSVINSKIKYRESFRPLAPSVKFENVSNWFRHEEKSPYMLFIADVKERSLIPAITHVDYSARLQTVHKKTNPGYWRLIDEFEKLTGCPVLINTSFNVRGEPVVCTTEDAYRCFMRTEMDYLVIENFLFSKAAQFKQKRKHEWTKTAETAPLTKTEHSEKNENRKFGLTMAIALVLLFGLSFPLIFDKEIPFWPWIASSIFLILATALPKSLTPIYKTWIATGHILGSINAKLILGIIFFFMFAPISLLFKMINRDSLDRKIYGNNVSSYWKTSAKQKKEHMKEIF